MAIKKRTQKQIAATKKMLTARKKSLKKTSIKKKRVAKKRVGTSQTKRSMLTGKKPSARLKKRRSKNTVKGHYPNPTNRTYMVFFANLSPSNISVSYYKGVGKVMGDRKSAAHYGDKSIAVCIANELANYSRSKNTFIGVVLSSYTKDNIINELPLLT